MLSGVDDVLLVAALAHAARHGRGLDELRTVADDGCDEHRGRRSILILGGIARTVGSAARAAASIGSSAVRHAAWYLRYQVDGTARARREPPRPRRTPDREED